MNFVKVILLLHCLIFNQIVEWGNWVYSARFDRSWPRARSLTPVPRIRLVRSTYSDAQRAQQKQHARKERQTRGTKSWWWKEGLIRKFFTWRRLKLFQLKKYLTGFPNGEISIKNEVEMKSQILSKRKAHNVTPRFIRFKLYRRSLQSLTFYKSSQSKLS